MHTIGSLWSGLILWSYSCNHAILFIHVCAPAAVMRKPVPKPGPGEVLVRVQLRPMNPADVMSLAGALQTSCAWTSQAPSDHVRVPRVLCYVEAQ